MQVPGVSLPSEIFVLFLLFILYLKCLMIHNKSCTCVPCQQLFSDKVCYVVVADATNFVSNLLINRSTIALTPSHHHLSDLQPSPTQFSLHSLRLVFSTSTLAFSLSLPIHFNHQCPL